TFVDGTLTVEQIDINDIIDEMKINLEQYSYVYDGTEKKPKVTSITVDGVTLTEGTDYTVRYEDNVNVGEEATAVITFEGNYDGTFRKWFTITKAYYNLTAPTPNTLTYNGEDQYLVSAGTVEGADFEYSLDGVSWSTSIPQAKDVGNYTVYYRVLADENHYGIEGTVDVTIKECTHEWGEGVLTRPVHDTVLGSKDGYYTYTCTVCGEEKTEAVKSADYSAYEAVSEGINALLQSDELTDAAKQAIYSAANECGLPSNDLTESEQNIVDDLVAELEKIVADAEEKIASGEYVKIDGIKEYNKIADALDAELMENYSQEEFAALAEKAGDEINARLGEIIEKAEALTGSVAENKDALAEIESELSALYAEVKNCLDGVHNGFVYEVTVEAKCEVNAIESATCTLCGETDEREVEGSALEHSFTKYEEIEAPKCGVAGKEISYCDNGCGATDEKEIAALEHIFLDYVSNGDATCAADGTKTAECANGCGKKDTVEDEGSKLDHVDENGDDLCDECGEDMHVSVADCECTCHRKDVLNQFFYKIIQLIRKLFGI
ncbi:MAG: hypothetical protein IJO24_00005, partial [Clostridia bacterium]|nr:hypothetical protein [Clostridia bacterium]